MKCKPNSRLGQTIVEAIVAVSFLTVGYVGILALLNRSLAAAAQVADQNVATYLAAEGVEVVKNLVDANLLQSRPYDDDFENGSYEVAKSTVLESDDPPSDPDNRNPGRWIGNQSIISSNPLLFDPILGYNYSNGTATKFFRTIRVTPDPGNYRMHLVSVVTWQTKGGGQASVQVEDFFFEH